MRDQVKKKLEEKGFVTREGHANYILYCPFCSREKRTMYIDMDTGWMLVILTPKLEMY